MAKDSVLYFTVVRLHILIIGLLIITSALALTRKQIEIKVSATNLSEDVSVASSKNDELILLIYEYSDDLQELSNPVFVRKFNFNMSIMQAQFEWDVAENMNDSYIFFLLELDSKKTEFQIDPILRVYYKNVTDCFLERNYLCIEKYLGDEDILGYGEFSIPSTHIIQGVYKLDRYNYVVSFK